MTDNTTHPTDPTDVDAAGSSGRRKRAGDVRGYTVEVSHRAGEDVLKVASLEVEAYSVKGALRAAWDGYRPGRGDGS